MNLYFIALMIFIVGIYFLESTAEVLDLRRLSPRVPKEFEDQFDPQTYQRSLNYHRDHARFGLVRKSFLLFVFLFFWLSGGFPLVDQWARGFGMEEIGTGLIFTGGLFLFAGALDLPFSIYEVFVIEERYGFNKMSWKTFLGDLLRGTLLSAILGGVVLSAVIWFFKSTGDRAWLLAWLSVTGFELAVIFVAPIWILPLFNRFKPLENNELKKKISDYLLRQDFQVEGVFTMDGSKRSTKANAFFTGFGRYRRIVLFDTLLEKTTPGELLAILAHEVGHYKKRHTFKFLILSVLTTGVLFYLLSRIVGNPEVFAAFKMKETSIYAGLIFVGILFFPLSRILGVVQNAISRKFEFEADAFSLKTFARGDALISGLKKLSTDHFSHLTPHPLKVLLSYSHPPILERIQALRRQLGPGG